MAYLKLLLDGLSTRLASSPLPSLRATLDAAATQVERFGLDLGDYDVDKVVAKLAANASRRQELEEK